MASVATLYTFLILHIVNCLQYGHVPTHVVKKYNIDNDFTQNDFIDCMGIKGYISRSYTIDKNNPLIQVSVEKPRDKNYKFAIKINANYWYNNNVECIIYKISYYIYSYYYLNIIELADNTYFILINKTFSNEELIYINKNINLFVEFYNETHTGIRWYNNVKYHSKSVLHPTTCE